MAVRAENHTCIYKGESWIRPFAPTYDRSFEITNDHACTLEITEGKNIKLSKIITDKTSDNRYFQPAITATESDGLESGEYLMTLTITNSATNYEYQKRFKLRVKD